jgi:hypothetical protein
MLPFPLIRLLADMDTSGGGDVPSLSAPPIAKFAVEEFGFRSKAVLHQGTI